MTSSRASNCSRGDVPNNILVSSLMPYSSEPWIFMMVLFPEFLLFFTLSFPLPVVGRGGVPRKGSSCAASSRAWHGLVDFEEPSGSPHCRPVREGQRTLEHFCHRKTPQGPETLRSPGPAHVKWVQQNAHGRIGLPAFPRLE